MRVVLVCSGEGLDVEAELSATVLGRREFDRRVVHLLEQARAQALERPALVVVDRDVGWAASFVEWLRANAATRGLPIAVLARGEVGPAELELISGGANAILRLPPGPEWDKRLARLMHVAVRRDARLGVLCQLDAAPSGGPMTFLAVSVNLSETGMLVECNGLEIGTEVHFAFRLPGHPAPVNGRARVCRQAGSDRFGLEFCDLSGECLEAIRGYVVGTRGSS